MKVKPFSFHLKNGIQNNLLLQVFSWLTTSQICLLPVFMKSEKCIRFRINQRNLFCLVCVLSYSRLSVTLWTIAHQAPLSMGFFQARTLDWVAISSSRGSSQPRDLTHISYFSCTGRQIPHPWTTWEPKETV